MAASRILLIHKHKVELFFNQVGTCHLDGDGIAQTIDTATAASTDAVVLLVKLIEIVIQATDAHQTLAMGLVKLDIQAPLGHTRDVTREHATQALAHELDLLILDGGALSVGSQLFLRAHVLALVLELGGVNALATGGILVEQAVNRQVGITANG